MDKNKVLTFNLTVDEINKVLVYLSKATYAEVFELIYKIQNQAQCQIGDKNEEKKEQQPE